MTLCWGLNCAYSHPSPSKSMAQCSILVHQNLTLFRSSHCSLIQGLTWVSSVQFSRSVASDFLGPHGLQHARPPCPSPTPRIYLSSCPLSWWCHPTISSSIVPFSSCFQSFPASGSFQMSQLFASGGQSIGVSASASVLPMNIQDQKPAINKCVLLSLLRY